MLIFTKNNNTDAVSIRLLKNLKINISTDAVIAELEKHPDYPSLLSISDILNNFHIENSAFRIKVDELKLVPCPFIVHTRSSGGGFLMVNEIGCQKLVVSSEKWNKHEIELSEFQKAFDGIVLAKTSWN